MLLSKDAIADVVEALRGHDFYRPAHEIGLRRHPRPLRARRAGRRRHGGRRADQAAASSTRVGGAAYLHTLIAIGADRGERRRTTRGSCASGRCCAAWSRPAPGSCRWGTAATGRAAATSTTSSTARRPRSTTVTERAHERGLRRRWRSCSQADDRRDRGDRSRRGGSLIGVPTGFADLDALTNGLHPGQMIIVAARPGDRQVDAGAGHRPLGARSSTALTGGDLLPGDDAATRSPCGCCPPRPRSRCTHMRDRARCATRTGPGWPAGWARSREAPLFIDDSPNMSMMEIRAKCRRLKQRHDLRLVVVDYLQLMTLRQAGSRAGSRRSASSPGR